MPLRIKKATRSLLGVTFALWIITVKELFEHISLNMLKNDIINSNRMLILHSCAETGSLLNSGIKRSEMMQENKLRADQD